MTVSQRSTNASFLQPQRGVKKSETERDVILHRHTKMTKAEASNGLGF